MDGVPYLRGLAIGFAIAAPIGPVGLTCIRKALADGRVAAWMAGLGAALADTLFGAVTGLFLGVIAQFLEQYATALKFGGGVFLLAVGARTWWAAANGAEPETRSAGGVLHGFAASFGITVTNPGTILGVVGVFAALGASTQPESDLQAGLLVGGIFCGSALWWAVLTEMTIAVRARFTPRRMRLFNHVSGALVALLGLAALASSWLG